MAKKKTAIGDLIKNDMSRRAIGEESEPFEVEKPFEEDQPEKPVSAKENTDSCCKAGVCFTDFIAKQAQAAGLTEEADLHNFYDFLSNQAMRYIRGFNAGRRFYG